jgi:uncharacterized membrane protein
MGKKIKRVLWILLIIIILIVIGYLIIKYVPFGTQTALETGRGLSSLTGQAGSPPM